MKLPRKDRMCDHKNDEFVVTFEKYLTERNEMLASDEEGREVVVDPFVGCAWEWQNAQELVGKKVEIKGFWSCNRNGTAPFLVDEGGITFV
jgi:hypothetical protein